MSCPSTNGLLSAAFSSPDIIFKSKHKEIEFALPLQGRMTQLRNISFISSYIGGAHHNFLLCNKISLWNSWKDFHLCGGGVGEKAEHFKKC
jgi:hypothetical protein